MIETRSFSASSTLKFSPPRGRNEITLENTAQGISATFDGPGSAAILFAFGTNVLPVNAPFGCETMQDVARWIRQQWPGWSVGVG